MTRKWLWLLILLTELVIIGLILWDYRRFIIDTYFSAKGSALKLLNKRNALN